MSLSISGTLEAWWETGTEGVHWAITTDGEASRRSYENLWTIQDDDELTIYGDNGEVVWSGIISLDRDVRWREYPRNPGYGQQEVGGKWVHGIQRGVDPDVWADFFWGHEADNRPVGVAPRTRPLRALLVRSNISNTR